jgi:hypothetical protein
MNSLLESSMFGEVEGITSVYELRRTLELDLKGHQVRIELWYCHSNANAPWEGRVYRRHEREGNWQRWTAFPWVQERNEETAIRQALAFLEERFQDRPEGGGFQRAVK